MNCETARQLILEALDEPHATEEGMRLAQHLAGCPACERYAALQRRLDGALATRFGSVAPSPAFTATVRSRIAAEAERVQRKAELREAAERERRGWMAAAQRDLLRLWRQGAIEVLGLASLIWVAAAMCTQFSGGSQAAWMREVVWAGLEGRWWASTAFGLAAAAVGGWVGWWLRRGSGVGGFWLAGDRAP